MKILFTILALTLCTTALSQAPPTTTTDGTTSTEQSTTSPDTTTTELSTSTTTEKSTTTTSTETPTTTTSTTASSTTEEPVTTSSPVTPTPLPAPERCTWNVTCIKAEMKVRFMIDMKGEKSYINLGCNATLNADCSSNVTQTLTLSEEKYTLTMVFEKESDKFSVKNITLDYDFPDGEKGFVSNDSDKLFNVKVGNSYLCRSETEIHLGNVTMQVSELHVQAFEDKDTVSFGTAEECDADDKVSGIIPIAVGIALAALILIVLIAYLVGRRRSRQRGYQSV